MTEKEMFEIIKEIAECNKDSCKDCKIICTYYSAITLFCEKVLPEGSVVLTEDEVYEFRKDQAEVKFLKNKIVDQARKETAKEIIRDIKYTVEDRNGATLEEDLSVDATILKEVLDEIAKQYGVEV